MLEFGWMSSIFVLWINCVFWANQVNWYLISWLITVIISCAVAKWSDADKKCARVSDMHTEKNQNQKKIHLYANTAIFFFFVVRCLLVQLSSFHIFILVSVRCWVFDEERARMKSQENFHNIFFFFRWSDCHRREENKKQTKTISSKLLS